MELISVRREELKKFVNGWREGNYWVRYWTTVENEEDNEFTSQREVRTLSIGEYASEGGEATPREIIRIRTELEDDTIVRHQRLKHGELPDAIQGNLDKLPGYVRTSLEMPEVD